MAPVNREIEAIFKREHGLLMATLVRATRGDFDAAEDALQEAFALAVEAWAREGIPDKPGAWLTTAARHRAIDRARRARLDDRKVADLARERPQATAAADVLDEAPVEDDRLRLIFTCCHPALDIEARVALTLRTLGGLTTDEVARAFLVPEPTMAQRLVRVKRKIVEAGIPYEVPSREQLPGRVEGVLGVIYLIFNEGYCATSGDVHLRRELCNEAIRLAVLVAQLLPGERDVLGLQALLLLQDARREARIGPDGELVLLEEQDRSRWDAAQIARGMTLLDGALASGATGNYTIQAAIAALHDSAARPEDTDWAQIAALYGELERRTPSPVVALNAAVALAMARGPRAGLERLDALTGQLDDYHFFHAARADLLRRDGQLAAAAKAYRAALAITANQVERRFLERRLRDVEA